MRPTTIIRSDDLRNENRRRLLDTLRLAGPRAPTELSELTGLSTASISILSSQLIEQQILISERSPPEADRSSRGRPRSQLSLNPQAGHAVTVGLNIDRLQAQLVDYAGSVRDQHQQMLDTRSMNTEMLLDTVVQSVAHLRDCNPGIRLLHIGVAFQGVTEHETGNLLWSPVIRERNVPLGDELRRRFAVSVTVNNDCRLISEALSHSHANTLGDTFATVLFSHGVGLGLYLKGQHFAGTRSSALEIGHMRFIREGALCRCGRRGCIEAYAADYGIERMASANVSDAHPTGRVSDSAMDELIARAQAGEQTAVAAFATAGAAVGEGLANLFTLLDPMPVAVVGHSDQAFELMREGIQTILDGQLRNGSDAAELLHCFSHEEPLLNRGLIVNSLCRIDHLFADQNNETGIAG
jgi:predicted NBD/HSP70 family sugar kinase